MPSISLKDDLDLDIEVEPSASSGIQKYFQAGLELFTKDRRLRDLAGLTLADPAVTSFESTLSVARPVPIDAGDLKLAIKGGVDVKINLFVPDVHLQDGKKDSLFPPDKYGEDIAVAKTERYLSLCITANAGPALSTRESNVAFGFAEDSSFAVATYQKFSVVPQAPTVLAGLKETFGNFQLPVNVADLQAMLSDSVITLAGTGSLRFSASANLLALSNPLATAHLPAFFGSIDVVEGASITVGGSFRLFGDFEIRARKIGPSTVRIGWFKEHGVELKATAVASAGTSLALGTDDLFSSIISALSADASADFRELQKANLDPATIASIQLTVQAAIQRSLEVALSFELGDLSETQAAFLYEADLDALDADGKAAIHNALRGDLSHLVGKEEALPRGIRMVQSIFTNLHQAKHIFRINLLGIYNYITLSKLTLSGRALYDPEKGELILTDTATASQIEASVVNAGGLPCRAEPRQLRRVMASSLLISAAYRASGCVVTPPSLKSNHVYCEVHDQTNRQTMRDELDAAVGLRLITRAEQDRMVGGSSNFGRTIAYASAAYNDFLATALFLQNDGPRSIAEYEDIGRQAMQIVAGGHDPADQIRLRPLQKDDLWKDMKGKGQTKFPGLIPDATPIQIGQITADYSTIVWWAKVMNQTGQRLVDVRGFLARNPNVTPKDQAFTKLRSDLADHLKGVAADSKEEFGRPWGLIAMDLLTGSRSDASVTFSGPIVNFARARAVPMTARATNVVA